mmetsp:Transcript_62221/g.114229  ORF Transcript_62221/g.114229 Transcript_62221/m.114229 type:complete len:796 (-) Transcript_62221:137-2524(-)
MYTMLIWVFICVLGTSLSQFTEVFSPDICTYGDCLIQGSEGVGSTLSLLQKAGRMKVSIVGPTGSKTSVRHDINTTEMLSSEAFQGFRWMASDTMAACRHDTGDAFGGRIPTLAACKSKCLEASSCMAFDFHKGAGQCNMYTAPCEKGVAVKKGSSSFRLHIFMKSAPAGKAAAQSLAQEPENSTEVYHWVYQSPEAKAVALKDVSKTKKGKSKTKSGKSKTKSGKSKTKKGEPETEGGEEGGEEGDEEGGEEKKELEIEVEGAEEINEFENEYLEEQIVAAVSVSLIFVFIVTEVMERRKISLLPEAAMVMLQGVLLGLIMRYWAKSTFMTDAQFRSEMSIELLNLVFLPLLMFESGWSVRRLDFISQFPYIMIFAVVGTLISTFVVGMLLYQTGNAGWHSLNHYRSCFVVASLISTTDPVATLATYSHLKVDPLLNIIVFGEAAINDAVGIVVFSIVNDDATMAKFNNLTDMLVFGSLKGLRIMSCSFLLGLLVSSIVCLSLKYFRMRDNKKLEIMIIVASCYLAFALGEYFKVSGIICTLFSGMITGQYARPHLSIEGSLLTSFVVSQMCMVMDAGVFLLSGVCCICLSFHGMTLGLSLVLICMIGRVCSTVPCGMVVNAMKRSLNEDVSAKDQHILSGKYLFMIWHAGLRGGIAENLSMQIGTWINELEGPQAKEAVRSSVFLVVAAYVLIFGGTTQLFLKMLKIPMGADFKEDALSATESGMEDWRLASWLHFSVFKPLLVGEEAELENDDINYGDTEGKDVEEILKDVCHVHRGGTVPRKNAAAQLQAD